MNPSCKHLRLIAGVLTSLLLFCQPATVLSVSSQERTSFFDTYDIVFLGDSTTNSLRYHGVLPDEKDTTRVWCGAQNTLSMWGLSSKKIKLTKSMLEELHLLPDDTNARMKIKENPAEAGTFLIPLSDLLALRRPACLVVTLGINGCSLMDKETFIKEYETLISTVKKHSPQTILVLNSVFPVLQHATVKQSDIDRTNVIIEDIAKKNAILFINSSAHLKENAFAPSDMLDHTDGIHWNKKGCQKIISVLTELLKETLFSPEKQPKERIGVHHEKAM